MKFWFLLGILSINVYTEGSKVKKDIASYSEADLERLYQEWEENDEFLDDSERSEHLTKVMNIGEMKAKASNPEDLLKITKKGQTLMMFVEVKDPDNPSKKEIRPFTEKWTSLWQSMLYNNHIDAQVFVIDDDRAIFMFKEGAQAFEAKNFLLMQKQVTEITLEGQQFTGAGASVKKEL